MVLKISELRQKYGISSSFETDEEALAYQEECEKAHEERVKAKVEELKAMYNSNKDKYSKFKNFTEEDWVDYAEICLKKNSSIVNNSSFSGLSSIINDPETAQWARYTYEEIIQMEANGVLIPAKVLAWAHSMQDSDVTAYEINEDSNTVETTEGTGENSENSELKELQKKTQTLSNKSQNAETTTSQKFDEFQETVKRAEKIKQEQETTKKDSLKQIEELTKEWDEISAKVKKGDKLTEAEQKRFKELGSMLNGKDGDLVTDIQASADDLQELMNSMDGLNNDIKENIELGDDTVNTAKELAQIEKGYKAKNTASAIEFDVTTGETKDLLYGAKGKDIAKIALDNGNNLIEFSNTLNNQLMMNQYASLYDFAEIFTQTSTETISNTKEVLGDDYNKTTEEINEEVDALPDMTQAENDRYNLEQNGVGLIGQAVVFSGKSIKETFTSLYAMNELKLIDEQTQKEKNKSQNLTDRVVNEMTSTKEEYDRLTEKKEKAEEKQETRKNTIENINDETDAEKLQQAAEETENEPEEEFTEEDNQTLEKLGQKLETTGNESQQKLFQSLSKIDGFEQLLKNKKLDGLQAIDYGTITKQIGIELTGLVPPVFFLMYIYAIGLMAIASGTAAKELGEVNNELYKNTNETTSQAKSSIGQNQIEIQSSTNIEAITPVSAGQGEDNSAENGDSEETKNEANSSEVNKNETEDSAVNTIEQSKQTETLNKSVETENTEDVKTVSVSNKEADITDETVKESTTTTISEGSKDETSSVTGAAAPVQSENKDGAEKSDDEEEMSTDSAQKNVDNMQKDTEEENADSIEKESETKKTEKELEKEMKAVEKNMQKDQKELDKIAKESQRIMQEKQQLAEEFEVLNAQNEEIIARQESSQNKQAQAAPAQGGQQGGLLTGSVQQNDTAVSGDDTSTLETNQARVVTISSRFKALDQKLNVNQTKVRKISTTSRKRHKKFEKLAKEKEKVIKENAKVEQQKQAKVQKSLSAVGIINNLFSITMSAGTILIAIGAAIPFGAGAPLVAAGSLMVDIGTNGMLACTVLKATILVANGNFEQAFMTMGMAAIQIATSFIPGAGAAAEAGTQAVANTTQAIGAGLNIVSAATDTVAQSQTLAGKEQSGWLNTVSQIAGAASVLTNVAGGFTNGKQMKVDASGKPIADAAGKAATETTKSAFSQASTFGKVTQIAQAVGSTATTTAQISALVKQAQGKETGKFENILNAVGFSISAAASLSQIGMKISDAAKNKKDTARTNDNNDKQKTDEVKDDKNVDKKDQEPKNNTDKADEKKNPDESENKDPQAANNSAPNNDTKVLNEDSAQNAEIEESIARAQEATESNDTKIDPETQKAIEDAQSTDTSKNTQEQIDEARSTDNNNQPEQTDEVQTSNVDNETEVNENTTNENAETEVEATSETGDKPEQEPDKSPVTPEQKELAANAAKKEGLEVGKSTEIAGKKFEITEDGKYIVDGKEVSSGDFSKSIGDAKVVAAANTAQKEGLEVGKSQKIAGERFEITEDGKYLVNGEEVSSGDFSKSISDAKAIKTKRQERMDTITDIGTDTLSAGSQVMQAYSALSGLNTSTEESSERTILKLSNMKKGKSLIRKIKKRKTALYGYTKSA